MCIKITRENIEILILMEVLIKINTFHMNKIFPYRNYANPCRNVIMKACQFFKITKFFSSQTELLMAYFLLAHAILVPQR